MRSQLKIGHRFIDLLILCLVYSQLRKLKVLISPIKCLMINIRRQSSGKKREKTISWKPREESLILEDFFFFLLAAIAQKKVADIVDSHLNDSSPIPLRCHLSQMFNFIICAVNRTATEIGFSRNSLFTSGMSGSIFCHGIGNRFSVESLCSCAFRRINIGNSLMILLLRRRCLHCHLA